MIVLTSAFSRATSFNLLSSFYFRRDRAPISFLLQDCHLKYSLVSSSIEGY